MHNYKCLTCGMEFDDPIPAKEPHGETLWYCPACHSEAFCLTRELRCMACGETTMVDPSELYCEECKLETRRSVMAGVAKLSERAGLSLNSSFAVFKDIADDEIQPRFDVVNLFAESVYNIGWSRECGMMTALDMARLYLDNDKSMRTNS